MTEELGPFLNLTVVDAEKGQIMKRRKKKRTIAALHTVLVLGPEVLTPLFMCSNMHIAGIRSFHVFFFRTHT